MKDAKSQKRGMGKTFAPLMGLIVVFSFVLVGMYFWILHSCPNCGTGVLLRSEEESLAASDVSSGRSREDCAMLLNMDYSCSDSFNLPTSISSNSEVTCMHSTRSDLEFLPDKDFYECLRSQPPKQWKQAQNEMFKRFEKIQNPTDCNKPNSEEFTKPTWVEVPDEEGFPSREAKHGVKSSQEFVDDQPKWNLVGLLHHGYAYNLFVFTWNVGNHWTSGVSVINGNSKYRFSEMECGKSWSCFWSPLSVCTINDIKKENVLVYYETSSARTVMDLTQLCKPNGYYDFKNGRCICDDGFMPSRFLEYSGCAPYHAFGFDKIPRRKLHRNKWESKDPKIMKAVREGDDFYFSLLAPSENNPGLSHNRVHASASNTRKKYGFMWEHAQWLWYLHKDAPKREFLDQYLRESDLDVDALNQNKIRAVGIHVRHGDSCHDKYQNHRVCLPLSSFMDAVKKLEAKYGKYDVVFLATDDPQVIEDTKIYENQGYKFAYQKISRLIYETGDQNGVDVRIEFNDPQLVKEIVADIWGISYCDAFVGSFASSVAWVAYELMLARTGFYPPFISVDMPYAHKKNVGRFLPEA